MLKLPMKKVNYYNCFLYNIHSLVNNFNFTPHWVDLNEETFFNHSGHSHTDFNTSDKFLQQYSKEKMGLGQDIIKNGTYAPFFFYNDEKTGKKLLYLGKHRLYSLLLCRKIQPLPRKFLFLECPVDPLSKEGLDDSISVSRQAGILYSWETTKEIPEICRESNLKEVNKIVLFTGDTLSNWLFDNKVKPSEIINNEEVFNQFIAQEPNLLLIEDV